MPRNEAHARVPAEESVVFRLMLFRVVSGEEACDDVECKEERPSQ
jgi:hypothetical protein